MHEFSHLFLDVLRNSVLITGLVMIMMLMIEYVNIHSHGKWFTRLRQNRFGQVVLGAGLGLVPGCMGGFAAVSMFSHKLLSFGALIAMMIATSGDEAFIMLAMILFGALDEVGCTKYIARWILTRKALAGRPIVLIALIVATAEKLGCHEIVTEDLNPNQTYRGMAVVNPFK